MSRFIEGEIDDERALLAWGRWEGRRKAVLNGRPAQAVFLQLERLLLKMPHKRLIEGQLCDGKTGFCVLGVMEYRKRVDAGESPRDVWRDLTRFSRAAGGVDYEYQLDGATTRIMRSPDAWETAERSAKVLEITPTLAELLEYENDEGLYNWRSPEERYQNVLKWVQAHIWPETRAAAIA